MKSLFKIKERKKPLEVEDMIWALKFLMAGEEEVKRIIKNFSDAIKYYEKT